MLNFFKGPIYSNFVLFTCFNTCNTKVARFLSSSVFGGCSRTIRRPSKFTLTQCNEFLKPQVIGSYLITSRHYAKKKSSSKLTNNDTDGIIDVEKMHSQMDATISHLRQELAEHLALRISISTISSIEVRSADKKTKLRLGEIGQVVQKSPALIAVNLEGNPQYVKDAKLAIINSGININPQVEGSTLFLPIQKVTREHRETLVKNAKAICDKHKDKLRHIQNSYQKQTKSQSSSYSKDLIKRIQDSLINTTREYSAQIDVILQIKEDELLQS